MLGFLKVAFGQLKVCGEELLEELLNGRWLLMGSYALAMTVCYLGNRRDENLWLRNKQRKEQETQERREAKVAIQRYVGKTTKVFNCEDMGSRLQKNWMCAWTLFSAAPLSKHCVLTLDKATLKILNQIMRTVKHRDVAPILDLEYDSVSGHMITVQQRHWASLRDLIYQQSDSTLDWAVKYHDANRLSIDDVRSYGRQILEAVTYLYRQGFPLLGHIQTGNIFVALSEEDGGRLVDPNVSCRLGGYENTLLGYRSRLYRSIESASELERIDMIMFGHVIYELGCGCELQGVIPEEDEYQCDPLKDNPELQEVLMEIFKGSSKSIAEILRLDFFASAEYVSEGEEEDLPENLHRFLSENYGQHKTNQHKTKTKKSHGFGAHGIASSLVDRLRR